MRGLILISPVLDFREFSGSSMLQYVWSLPTMAAVAREAKGAVTRADMADVENYARGEFLADLVKGEADTEATTRLADKVAALTGIDQAVSRRLAGRFDAIEFRREFDRKDGKVTGRYDASVTGFDPYPDSSFYHFNDPSGETLIAPLTSAAVDLTTRKLNWRPDGSYHLLNGAVEKAWDFGHGLNPPESISELRQILALDPKLKLLVGHGLFDLATPYFGTQDPARPAAGLRVTVAGQARGLSRRPHVLFARRLAPGVPRRGRGADEVSAPRVLADPAALARPVAALHLRRHGFLPPHFAAGEPDFGDLAGLVARAVHGLAMACIAARQ